jgi:type IV secretory pathway VirB2 component (pilin)
MTEEDPLTLANERLDDWNRRAKQWYIMYYAFGSLAVLLTVTVASRPDFISKDTGWLSTLAWLAAIFQGLSTFLTALPKATAYRAAWRTLWLARLDFIDSSESDDSRKQLKQAIAKGWSIIDGGYADAFKVESRRTSPSTQTSRKRSSG